LSLLSFFPKRFKNGEDIIVIDTIGISGQMHREKYLITSNIKGEILGVRTVQNRGRVQIPKKIRDLIDLRDGDNVYWLRGLDGRFYIAKAVELR